MKEKAVRNNDDSIRYWGTLSELYEAYQLNINVKDNITFQDYVLHMIQKLKISQLCFKFGEQ
eukprot:UN29640